MDVNELIRQYFNLGLSQSEILSFLFTKHDIKISKRTLKRRLKCMQLYRKKYFSSYADIIDKISEEINASGKCHGYKWLHLKLVQKGLVLTQSQVRMCLNILDAEGIDLRKKKRLTRRKYYSKGPNFLWHADGYDKLKPYGFGISGCIDGYSRKIIWLKVGQTNNDSQVIEGR